MCGGYLIIFNWWFNDGFLTVQVYPPGYPWTINDAQASTTKWSTIGNRKLRVEKKQKNNWLILVDNCRCIAPTLGVGELFPSPLISTLWWINSLVFRIEDLIKDIPQTEHNNLANISRLVSPAGFLADRFDRFSRILYINSLLETTIAGGPQDQQVFIMATQPSLLITMNQNHQVSNLKTIFVSSCHHHYQVTLPVSITRRWQWAYLSANCHQQLLN